MFYFDKILDELRISNSVKEFDDNITYYCVLKTDNSDSNIPFMVVFDLEDNNVGIFFPKIIQVEKEDEYQVLKILSEFNKESLYGTFYFADNMYLEYYLGISLEGTDNIISKEQFSDYLRYMISNLRRLIKEMIIYYKKQNESNNQANETV